MKPFVPSARLDFRRLRVALAALVLFAWLGAPACSSSNAGEAELALEFPRYGGQSAYAASWLIFSLRNFNSNSIGLT
jgi:hypothetical protein